MDKKFVLKVLNGWTLVLLFVCFVAELLICFDLALCLTLRKILGWSPVAIGIVVAIIAAAMLLANGVIVRATGAKLLTGPVMILAIFVAMACEISFDRQLPYWTMRPGFDTDLYIDEYGCISGKKLGTYAMGILTDDTPIRLYWQCSSVTSYGPIRYGGDLDELFITMDTGEILIVSADEYADGTWITVKEFMLGDEMLMVFFGEDDAGIMADYLGTIQHEVVNLSGKTVEEISQILDTATWNTLTWTADGMEKEKLE